MNLDDPALLQSSKHNQNKMGRGNVRVYQPGKIAVRFAFFEPSPYTKQCQKEKALCTLPQAGKIMFDGYYGSFGMNSGYAGWSMSKRAVEAYESGEMPKSKWTKTAIINAIFDAIAISDEQPKFNLRTLENYSRDTLFCVFLTYKSWHHTSSHCNKTDFYGLIDLSGILAVTDHELIINEKTCKEQRKLERERKKKAEENPELWLCEYLTWSGSRKHPKPEEHIGAGIIQGNWFKMANKDNHLEFTKITNNGFRMLKPGIIKNKTAEEYYVVIKWNYRKDSFVERNAVQIKGDKLVKVEFREGSKKKGIIAKGYIPKTEVEKHPNIWVGPNHFGVYVHHRA